MTGSRFQREIQHLSMLGEKKIETCVFERTWREKPYRAKRELHKMKGRLEEMHGAIMNNQLPNESKRDDEHLLSYKDKQPGNKYSKWGVGGRKNREQREGENERARCTFSIHFSEQSQGCTVSEEAFNKGSISDNSLKWVSQALGKKESRTLGERFISILAAIKSRIEI